MAKALNKSRMKISRILVILAVATVLFTRQTFPENSVTHEFFDMLGLICLVVCALGRVYSTAFLGGHKNKDLISFGPYSVVRNPLYMFSLIGITGIALMSNQWIVMLGLPVAFYFLYISLIKREEHFLHDAFGQPYAQYLLSVPRLFPDFKNYKAPETILTSPEQLWHAARDATWWVSSFILFEVVEAIQALGWLPTID